MPTISGINIVQLKQLIYTNKRVAEAILAATKGVEVVESVDIDINDISKGTQTNDVKVTLDSEVVAVDATGQGDVPITLDSEIVVADVTGQGDVPVTLGGEVPEVQGDAAENAAVSGNPLLCGGRYDSSARTLGNGDVGALALYPDGGILTKDFLIQVQRGLVPGMSMVHKY
ncbi:MAG: hypothetical protein ACXABD_20625, partial [Candidatus Thorarchaeota archaeon]